MAHFAITSRIFYPPFHFVTPRKFVNMELGTLLFGLALILLIIWAKNNQRGKSAALPPGPLTLPFLGSIFVLPGIISDERRHQLRIDLAKKYGKILRFRIGNLTFIWLNDMNTIKEAFVAKGDLISDRTWSDGRSFFGAQDELAKFTGLGIGEANYNKAFKERKRLALHCLKEFGFGGVSIDEKVVEEARLLVTEMRKAASRKSNLSSVTDIHNHVIHLAVSNVICSVVFGRRFDYADEKFVAAVNSIRFLFGGQKSGNISRVPLVKYLPAIQRLAEKEKNQGLILYGFIQDQIMAHEAGFNPDEEPKDFIDLCLQKADQEKGGGSVGHDSIGTDNVKKIVADLFIAGTDTTATSLSWVLLYMIRFPDIQRRCQLELDTTLPDLGEENLTKESIAKFIPYTTATLLEVQRVSTIANASLPHIAREDVTVAGYHVPKDSTVMANIRFLHFDDRYWDHPEDFNPDRWVKRSSLGDANGERLEVIQHSHFIPFSIGKRRCLGENLAKVEYFLFAVFLLKNFEFHAENDAAPPSLVGSGLIHAPKPFNMILRER